MAAFDNQQALVLSGGGAKGAYEVGVMKGLFDGRCPSTDGKQLDPGVFTGTSVGSFNAAIMASKSTVEANETVRHLESIWLDRIADRRLDGSNAVFRIRGLPSGLLDPRSLTGNLAVPLQQLTDDATFLARDSLRRLAQITRSRGSFPRSLLDFVNLSSFLSLEPLHELLRETISVEDILGSKKILRIATTNWRTGTLRVFRSPRGKADSRQDLMDRTAVRSSIAASTAIPGIFPPVTIDGEPYVDGGAVMNTPLQPAILAGANVLHVVYLDPELEDIHLAPVESTLQSSGRLFALMLAVITNRDIAAARRINRMLSDNVSERSSEGRTFRELTIHRYRPKADLGGILGMLDFSYTNLKDLIALGEKDASTHDCKVSQCVLSKSVG